LYFFKEYAKLSGKSSKAKAGARQTANNDSSSGTRSMRGRQKDAQGKDDSKLNKDEIQKRKIVEAEAREEGEISESEAETKYRLDKEEKWLEWCSEVLDEEQETLKRLNRLQNTSLNLPKEKVFAFSIGSIFLNCPST
jgi:chromodomain-helicase-DNA-binding protein 1